MPRHGESRLHQIEKLALQSKVSGFTYNSASQAQELWGPLNPSGLSNRTCTLITTRMRPVCSILAQFPTITCERMTV